MTRWQNHPIRLARQRKNVTQSGLAREIGVTRGAITAIEQARVRMPKPETLQAIATHLGVTAPGLRAELVAWLAAEEKVELSTRARATLQLEARHIPAYRSFTHWREQIVDTPTAFAILLRINSDVVFRYEQGKDSRGMPDRLAGALQNVLGVSEPYLQALQALPVGG